MTRASNPRKKEVPATILTPLCRATYAIYKLHFIKF